MSVGFRPFSPLPPFKEQVYWRAGKDGRTAEARVRVLSVGLELRVLVGPELAAVTMASGCELCLF